MRCSCPGCLAGLSPFTVPHFRAWSRDLILDSRQPFQVEPFQEIFLADLFTGTPEVWLVVPEGNGKTSFLAAVGLYYGEHKPGAQIPVAASSRDQGKRPWEQAMGFVKRSPRLRRVFKTYRGYRRIDYCRKGDLRARCDEVHSEIEIFAADEDTGDGVFPDLALVEEGHRHKDLGLYRTWRGKLDKRRGQIVMISTSGELGGEFEQTRARIHEATPIVERRRCYVRARSEQLVIHDYAIPEDGDPDDLELVKEANPLSTITVETLRAKRASPTHVPSHWRRMVCNRGTRSEDSAITEVEWARAATDVRIPDGASIELGLDAGWKWDTFAMVPLWTTVGPDGRSRFDKHEEPLRSKLEFATAMSGREARGSLRILGPATVLVPPRDGNSLAPQKVKDAFLGIHERTPIARVVMDITHANDIAGWIRELGIEVLEWSQGDVQQAKDYDAFMEGLRGGMIRHSADPALTEHAMNAIAKPLGGGRFKFERKSSSRNAKRQARRVIDALVAAAMVNSASSAPAEPPARDLPAPSRSSSRSTTLAGIGGRSF